ncbi:MAG: recombinase family protein [Deltaproteobacteria bacterium]|nr:recombinase family protein [Deltaproteobacteria bacterium]
MARRNGQNADPKKAIAYVRCSTDEQHLGPDAQRAALAAWCSANGTELVATFADLGISGGAALDHRPGLTAAVAALTENGAGLLLVAKRDRLARDVVIAATVERLVERAGARVRSIDGTGEGDGPEAALMRTLIDAFAAYERALIKSRTKAALSVKAGRGERVGQVPYGYHLAADGAHLEADAIEQERIAVIRALRADGLTLREIADRLNSDAVPARGQRWHTTSVARLLRRAA